MITGGRNTDGKKDDQGYTAAEYEFGRENLRKANPDFTARMKKLVSNVEKYLQDEALQEESKAALERKKERLEGVLRGEIK